MNESIMMISYVIAVILGIGGVISTISYFNARAKSSKSIAEKEIASSAMDDLKTTVEAVKTQNVLQAGQITQANTNNKILSSEVSELRGKVDTLSTIPLAKIEQHMADTNRILQTILPLIPSSTVQHSVLETTTTSK